MTGADACADSLSCATGNATHGYVYGKALKDDLIETIRDSEGRNYQSFRGMAVVVDDLCPMTDRNYTSILFTGRNRLGFDSAACCRGHQDRKPAKRGQRWRAEILHSRVNLAIHPATSDGLTGPLRLTVRRLSNLALLRTGIGLSSAKAVGLAFLIARVT